MRGENKVIYFCADDYGLCDQVSHHIRQGIHNGVLNKVSVFPNFCIPDLNSICESKEVRLSLHLNLVEGKCMANREEINLLADKNGNLKHRFGGLFRLWLFRTPQLEEQLYREIKAQVLFWNQHLPKGVPFCIDSHQHTHMIPAVFRALVRVLTEENIALHYMRIPAEPILPYLKTPSLYTTYQPANLLKQWLLNFLWLINQKQSNAKNIPTSLFMGILFSGKMEEKRVRKMLPKYQKIAEKKGLDIEVLFHPGYLSEPIRGLSENNIVFQNFYYSKKRKTEFDSVMKLSERSVM